MRCRWFVWSRPLVALTLAVAGCGSGTTATEPTDGTTTVTTTTDGAGDTGTASSVGLANPASQYCVAQGGEVLIVTAADGSQSGRCRLPDGTEVDGVLATTDGGTSNVVTVVNGEVKPTTSSGFALRLPAPTVEHSVAFRSLARSCSVKIRR